MLASINLIANTSGINAKKILLAHACDEHPLLSKLLKYAYDPYLNFYIKKLPVVSSGNTRMNESAFEMLDHLASRSVTGHAAIKHYVDYTSTLPEYDQAILRKVMLGDFRMGLNTKSINQIYPGLIPTFDVMLAQKVNWLRIIFPCYSSVKLDGVRGIYEKGLIKTRSGKVLHGLEHILEQLEGHQSVDGELMVRGADFNTGCGNIRTLGSSPNAFFCLFDAPDSENEFYYRMRELKEITEGSAHLKFVKHQIVNSRHEAEQHYIKCREAGYEGTVLKPLDYVYVNKRSFDWMKIKAVETEDCEVIGSYEGTGRNEGRLGGLIVDFKGIEVRVGGGYSDGQREAFWRDRGTLVDHMIEIHFQEVTPDGSMRHPNFVKFRPDKDVL